MKSYDVAIIGGGPAGSTCGAMLKKYAPELKVAIFEREKFPRDHVGESLLPPISKVFVEMGCWDKIEGGNFPIKVGATYKWGKRPELWDLDFIPADQFIEAPRPAKYEGQRTWTAFQVDRSKYDKILLDHAKELGCEVFEETRVLKVDREGDRVTGLTLEDGEAIEAKFYLDASGHSGILRRAMGVKADSPTTLQNIAIWQYWDNAEWAVEIGVGGTRIQVLSISNGWMWFIPLGPTRTSIGLVVPAEYYKKSGATPEQLYKQAVAEEERVATLTKNAVPEEKLYTTKDWSFLAERQVGENWFLIGEAAGFADPILSAGLTLAHWGAREAAYTIIHILKKPAEAAWAKQEFASRQQARITNHIRFADYWYTANEQFSDLKDFTARLAAESGLELTPEKAWDWIAQGGFVDQDAFYGAGLYSIDQLKDMSEFMSDTEAPKVLTENNVFKLNLTGAQYHKLAWYKDGKITNVASYRRDGKTLPVAGVMEAVVSVLQYDSKISGILKRLAQIAEHNKDNEDYMNHVVLRFHEALEALISDGWVEASYDPSLPLPPAPHRLTYLQWNQDELPS